MSSDQLPEPRLTFVYRLEATLGQPLHLGDVAQGHRRLSRRVIPSPEHDEQRVAINHRRVAGHRGRSREGMQ